MLKAAELAVVIGADTKQAESSLVSVQNRLAALGKQAGQLGRTLSIGLTVPLGALAVGVAKVGIQAEQTRIAFSTLLGSAEAAGQYLEELADFAARTPFGLTELEQASRMMLAYGFAAQQVIPTLRIVGDAAAGLGIGAEGVDRIIRALGQMQAKGKVAAQEMMQLSEAGIASWRYLAEAMGVSIAEVMQLSERGAISSSKAIEAILAGMRRDFGGLMEEQSKTAGGALSNLRDELEKLGRSLAEVFLPQLTEIIRGITNLVQQFQAAPNEVKKLTVYLTGIGIAAGPMLVALDKVIAVVYRLRTVMATLTLPAILTSGWWGVIGLSLAVITQRFYDFFRSIYGGILDVQKAWQDYITGLRYSAGGAQEALQQYQERQDEVARSGGLLGRALLWVSERLGGVEANSTALAQTLLATSASYADYQAAMTKAGLAAMMYTEQQWQVAKALAEQSDRARFLKDDYIDLAGGIDVATASSQSLIEYADDLKAQYDDIGRYIQDINGQMQTWIDNIARLVTSGLDQWFGEVRSSTAGVQREIERLNEEIAKQKERLRTTREEEDRARLQERIAELQRHLAEKTKELSAAQADLSQSTIRYEAALAMVDEIMGTNYYSTYQLEKSVQNLVDEYTRTGDLDAFRAGLIKIKNDGLQPLQSALEGAIKKAQELYDKLMQLPEEIRISIKIDAPPSIPAPSVTQPPASPLPNIVPRQYGGLVTPGRTYLVGERGPELFIPSMSGQIVPQVNSPINVTVNAEIANELDIEYVAQQIARLIQANRPLARMAL